MFLFLKNIKSNIELYHGCVLYITRLIYERWFFFTANSSIVLKARGSCRREHRWCNNHIQIFQQRPGYTCSSCNWYNEDTYIAGLYGENLHRHQTPKYSIIPADPVPQRRLLKRLVSACFENRHIDAKENNKGARSLSR